MSDDGTKQNALFQSNAYSKILPDYIKSLAGAGSSYDEVFSGIERLFDTVLELSDTQACFVVYWSDNLNHGQKLSVPFFKSSCMHADDFESVISAVGELLVTDATREPKSQETPLFSGFVFSVPIYTDTTSFGYAVVFYKDKNNESAKLCTPDSPQIEFLANAMYLTALFFDKDTNSKRFEHFLMNDYLTELPNRTHLYESMVFSLQTADFVGTKFALLIIRVDGLKHINNSLGIIVGDLMLKEMGAVIRSALDASNLPAERLVARLSGGDFAILLTYPADAEGGEKGKEIVRAHCEAIISKMNDPVDINNYKLYPSVSIGASLYPEHGETPEALLRRADLAKSTAKQEGHNIYRIYDDLMEGASDKMLFLSNNLPVAIASNQFELFYQAQADTETERIIGAEALIRWNHPDKGLIYPGDFIAYAEDNGYGIQIDMLVLDMVCEQIIKWREKGIDLVVSVNISPKHFVNGLIFDTVSKLLAQTSIKPSNLKVELLESVLLEDFDIAVRVIKSLQTLGVLIALDDFGAGYSSLEYVAMLPLDYLKIDRTFTMNLDQCPSNKTILKTIMTLAAGMGVKTIAEGVETKEQLEFLRSIGCDIAQGYYINKPMPVQEFEKLLNRGRQGDGSRGS